MAEAYRDCRWQRFAEELGDIDLVFQAAVFGLESVLQNGNEEDEDTLKGLEIEDTRQNDSVMAVGDDDDDVLAQMEARLAKLSRVSVGQGDYVYELTEKQNQPHTTGVPSADHQKHASADHSHIINGGLNESPSNIDGNEGGCEWVRLDDSCWKPCPIGVWGSSTRK